MSMLDATLLDRCTAIRSREELLTLLADVCAATRGLRQERTSVCLESDLPAEQAAAMLCCAAHGWPPEPLQIESAFGSDSREVLAAASLCLAACLPDEVELQRKLLLGPDTYTAPKTSENARFFLIEAMRTSGDVRFVPVLHEALREHYHFCWAPLTSRALEEILQKSPDDEDENPSHRSISVWVGTDSKIFIGTDEHFTGSSSCIHCRFFPCRINRFYRGGIEDCKLWNRIDPETLGGIVDQRLGWGDHPVDVGAPPSVETRLEEARGLLAHGQTLLAIPLLCSALIEDNFETSAALPAWILLSICLSACGEPVLAFLMMREVAAFKNLVAVSAQAEKDALSHFVDDPAAVLGPPFTDKDRGRLGLRALGYRKHKLYTRALDCHAEETIRQGGQSGGTWFEMGECHRELGEYHLAELCMRRGARKANEIGLRERFLEEAEAVRSLLTSASDPGLALDRRAADRAASEPSNICV